MTNTVETQDWLDITAEEVKSAKWKPPVIDKILNFWLYSLPSIPNAMANIYSKIMNNPETSLLWLSKALSFPAYQTYRDFPKLQAYYMTPCYLQTPDQ